MITNSDQKLDFDKPVDCAVSGYEWICPNCNFLNKEIEYGEKASCNQCMVIVELDIPEYTF